MKKDFINPPDVPMAFPMLIHRDIGRIYRYSIIGIGCGEGGGEFSIFDL